MIIEVRVRILQHNDYCGSGSFIDWATERGYKVQTTLFGSKDWKLPEHSEYDWLVIVGGTMCSYLDPPSFLTRKGVNDDPLYDWLPIEKQFVKDAIAAQKVILGICFGAQMLAHCLGIHIFY